MITAAKAVLVGYTMTIQDKFRLMITSFVKYINFLFLFFSFSLDVCPAALLRSKKHSLTVQTSRSLKAETATQHGKTHQAICKIHAMVKSFSLYNIHINTNSPSTQTHSLTYDSCQDNGTDADKVG